MEMIIRIIKVALAFVSTLFLPYSTENFQNKDAILPSNRSVIIIIFLTIWQNAHWFFGRENPANILGIQYLVQLSWISEEVGTSQELCESHTNKISPNSSRCFLQSTVIIHL